MKHTMCKLIALLLVCLMIPCGFAAFAEEVEESVSAGLSVARPENYDSLKADPYAVMTPMPEGYVPPEPGTATSGTAAVFASEDATMDLANGLIRLSYTHGWGSNHKLVIQMIYTDGNGDEHLLAQSGILAIGAKLDRMDTLEALPVGDYDCQLGLFFFTGEQQYAAMSTRVAIKLHVVKELPPEELPAEEIPGTEQPAEGSDAQ